MKFHFFIVCFIVPCFLNAQADIKQIDRKLDSLQTAKLNTEQRIKAYEEQLKQINREINHLQTKKKQLMAELTGDFIQAKTGDGGAVLREKPSSVAPAVANIPPNTSIKVYKEQDNLYFKVEYNGQIGYVSYSTIAQNQEIDDFLMGKTVSTPNSQQTSTTVVRTIDENDPKYQKLVKLYGKDVAIKIINNEVWEGMSVGQVIESIGKPQSKTTLNSDEGVKEVWEYTSYTLEFFNGAVRKIIKK